ncbi:hypothetical protein QR674_12175 [Acinetobacter chinensis]|uniref:Uncharacterized protein n=1 Tax=Acinetobacter chinensis TaxID=2004650 RepID=A0ABU3WIN4_9GAMM|nr:hypothetical protein [Acinetobacter chinensis]MDV2469737.1 hypothetical protein [Acinetobacter chinensis]
MWKKIRVSILLVILLIVAVNAWRDMNQDWTKPVIVLLHPVNADGSEVTQAYIQQLSAVDMIEAQDYILSQSQQLRGNPVQIYFQLGRQINQLAPKVPETGSMADTIIWSLKFRYYAWRQQESADGRPGVTLYLNYYDPKQTKLLKHSVALQRGKIGSVNLFASGRHSGSNKVVMLHELMHTFGATDKYSMQTGQPVFPEGYAAPDQQPLFPQKRAELMGGYIPLSNQKSITPSKLEDTMISTLTAQEMGWLK